MLKAEFKDSFLSPVCFETEKTIPKPDGALYIVDFDEIFFLKDSKEISHLLSNIENFIKENKIEMVFCEMGTIDKIEFVRDQARQYLDKNSVLLNDIGSEGMERLEFMQICEKEKVKTLYMGGVYGEACVWEHAKRLGDVVYAQRIGSTHPNIFYRDKEISYRFKHVVIFPPLTEGYFKNEQCRFPDFLKFLPIAFIQMYSVDGISFKKFLDSKNPKAFQSNARFEEKYSPFGSSYNELYLEMKRILLTTFNLPNKIRFTHREIVFLFTIVAKSEKNDWIKTQSLLLSALTVYEITKKPQKIFYPEVTLMEYLVGTFLIKGKTVSEIREGFIEAKKNYEAEKIFHR